MTNRDALLMLRGAAIGAAIAWAAIVYPARDELGPDFIPSEAEATQQVAYTLGVAEGARQEALRYCECSALGLLGKPCPDKRAEPSIVRKRDAK